MQLAFGKKNGKLLERLLIEDPGYIQWILGVESPSGRLATAANHARQCLARLDHRPFIEACSSCKQPATRMSLYRDACEPWFWCQKCSPYSLGAEPGRLTIVTTYQEVIDHVRMFANTNESLRFVADRVITAKGLLKPRTDKKLVEFFTA